MKVKSIKSVTACLLALGVFTASTPANAQRGGRGYTPYLGHYYAQQQMQWRSNNFQAGVEALGQAETFAQYGGYNSNPYWAYGVQSRQYFPNGGQPVYAQPQNSYRTTTPMYIQPRAICTNYLGQQFYC